jgi:hypothetical protein
VRLSRSLGVAVAIAGGGLASCTEPAPSRPAFTVTDSAGVEIVVSRLPERPVAATLAEAPSLTIGETAGAGEQLLDGVLASRRDDDGTLTVCNRGDRTIRRYAADGRLLGSAAGSGGGPSELRRMTGCFFRAGEIWVYQAPALPVKRYDPDGAFLGPVPLPRPGGRVALLLGVFEDGTLLLRQDASRREMPMGEAILNGTLMRTLPGADGWEALDTLGTFPTGVWLRADRLAFPQAFSPTLQAMPLGGSVFVGWPTSYDFALIGAGGVVRRRVRRAWEAPAASAADRGWFERRILEGPMPGGDTPFEAEEIRRRIIDMMTYPGTLPAYYRVLVDRTGVLWLERGGAPRDPLPQVAEPYLEPTRWDLFGADGRWLGAVALPGGLAPLDIGADYLLGVHYDELGVEQLRVYALDRAAS